MRILNNFFYSIFKIIIFTPLIIFLLSFSGCVFWISKKYYKKNIQTDFDMAEIVGSSSNNPYGIRNDVFDFITQDINDLNTPEFNDVKLKNIIYNKVKSDFLKIKYFRDTSKVIIIENKSQVIYECIFINDSDALMELHFSWHSEYGYGRLENVIYKTDDLEAINDRISDITNDRFMNHRLKEKFLNQNLDICNLFLDDVLSEEEFLKPNIEIEKMYDK